MGDAPDPLWPSVGLLGDSCLFRTGEPRIGHSILNVASPGQRRGRGGITSLNLLATLFVMHPRMPLAFLASRAHSWLMAKLLFTRTPRSFFSELSYCRSFPNLFWCMWLFLPINILAKPHQVPLCQLSACPHLNEWLHGLLVCQPLLPALYHQQTCWGWTLSLHPGHWWRCWTRSDPALSPGEHC